MVLRAKSSSETGRRLALTALSGIAQVTSLCWTAVKQQNAVGVVRDVLTSGRLPEQEEAIKAVKSLADSTAGDPKLCEQTEELLDLIQSGSNNDDIFFGSGVERPHLELDAAFNMLVPGQSRKRKSIPVHVVNTPW